MSTLAKAKKQEEVALSPIEKAKTMLFKASITEAVQKASLGIQGVAAVTDEITKATLSGLIKHAKEIRVQVKGLAKVKTDELDAMKKTLQAAEASFAGDLDSWINAGIKKISDYNTAVIKKQQEEQARIQAEQEKKLKRLSSPKSIAAVELASQVQLQQVAAPTGIRKVWGFDVTNEAAVPREYLCIDEAKVKAAIKEGVREIPGLKIEQKVQTVIR